ncbi:MAG: hypothetical protein VB876_14445 [Pirellulales bacterium]
MAVAAIPELGRDSFGYLPDRKGHGRGRYRARMNGHSCGASGTGEQMADEMVESLKQSKPPAKD